MIGSYRKDSGMIGTWSLGIGYGKAQDVGYHLMTNVLVIFRDKIYVSDDNEFKKHILQEFHVKLYLGHLGYQKTLTVVKKLYY